MPGETALELAALAWAEADDACEDASAHLMGLERAWHTEQALRAPVTREQIDATKAALSAARARVSSTSKAEDDALHTLKLAAHSALARRRMTV